MSNEDQSARHWRHADQCLRIAKRCGDLERRSYWATLAGRQVVLALSVARPRRLPVSAAQAEALLPRRV